MNQQRAVEIFEACKRKAIHGPWSDQLDKCMTPQERESVINVWDTMPGYTCFADAFMRIVKGIVCDICNGTGKTPITLWDQVTGKPYHGGKVCSCQSKEANK